VPSYNPFKDYFTALSTWDENDRDYIVELADHVKAKDQKQFNLQFKKMLVRTIACAIDDTVFNKQAFILVGGEQHTGKSTFCRFLCPDALMNYYTETIPSEKDGLICLCENLFINLDELHSLPKFELNKLKTMFSIIRVRVRHPFARKAQTDYRRASFIGSTNDDTFLTDTTGSVRWLCFDIDSIVFDYEKIGIDNVWRQAYSLYKTGFKYQLTADEIKENESRNEQYQQVSMEYEYVQMYLSPGNVMDHNAFWTTTQIREHILTKSERKADMKSLDKLGKVLKQLKFDRVIKRSGESMAPTRGYYVNFLD
jgi:predicted P-loop ATPase